MEQETPIGAASPVRPAATTTSNQEQHRQPAPATSPTQIKVETIKVPLVDSKKPERKPPSGAWGGIADEIRPVVYVSLFHGIRAAD